MLFLIQRVTSSWRAGQRSRLLYGLAAIAFGALAVAGVALGNVAVAIIATIVAVATMIGAFVAPRLSVGRSHERTTDME